MDRKPPSGRSLNAGTAGNRTRRSWRLGLPCGCLVLAWAQGMASPAVPPPAPEAQRFPHIAPDYLNVVIPPNLAPLNLAIQEPGTEYRVRVSGTGGAPLELRQSQSQVRLPLREWKELLVANRGAPLRWEIAVRNLAGVWVTYAPFETQVAEEAIDPYLVYRRLGVLFSTYKRLGIYQRNIETFEEQPVLRNQTIEHGCVNCHTPFQGASNRFAISFRGRFGTPTMLIDSNHVSRVDAKLGYLSWHPTGKLLAFAANDITQFFHVAGPANRDVYDSKSDLGILHVDEKRVEKPAVIAAPDQNENWPCWAPDGRYLYYCSGPTLPFEEVGNARYNLLRIPYDPDLNQWGKPETLISGAEHRLSVHQPRVSPDGGCLVFTVTGVGVFPLFRSDSDLFLLRLDTLKFEPLPINSNRTETWHSWSSNGRWLVFGSRRLDGVFSRLFITHVDPGFRFSRPLLLPQEDPAYYDSCIDNFNAPEFARGPVQISEEDLARAVLTTGKTTGPTPQDSLIHDQALDRSMTDTAHQ